jgi:signal transduction histidine kinase
MRWFRALPPQVLVTLLMAAVISMVVLAVSELSAARVNETLAQATRLRSVLVALDGLRMSVAQAESAQRGFLLTHERVYLEPFSAALQQAQKSSVNLAALTQAQEARDARAEVIVKLATQRLDELRLIITYEEQGRREQALTLMKSGLGLQMMNDLAAQARSLEEDTQRQLAQRQEDVTQSLLRQRVGVGVVVLINLGFLAALANLLIRQFMVREQHRVELQRQAALLEQEVAARTEELSSLSAYLQASGEREKSTLARDLHDELGGILTSAKIDVAWLEGHAKATDPEVLTRMRRLSGVIDEAIDLKRRVIENLRPSLLDHLGLSAALEWYVNETCGKAGLRSVLTLPEMHEAMDPDVAIAIFRIVQEGLTNALKYARASEVTVSLQREDGGWHLLLEDDGIGIQNFKPGTLSHGLAGMRQRALTLGGRFTLTTAPGQGTRIDAYFPSRSVASEGAASTGLASA